MAKVPSPWFKASSSARQIRYGVTEEPLRPLREGERRLGAFILPPFQRPSVWSLEQKTLLIESVWDGLPIGTYVVNESVQGNLECADWLLDGQQRWTAIIGYCNDEFPVYGHFFSELDLTTRRNFLHTPIGENTCRLTDPQDCLRVYERLAYGGTTHEPKEDAEMTRGFRP